MNEDSRNSIRSDVSAGVVDGIKAAMADRELMEKFWHGGYTELVRHGSNNANQWVGKRILTWLITSITIAGLIWLVKSGALKP